MLNKIKGRLDIFGKRSLLDYSLQYYMFPFIELLALYYIKEHNNPYFGLFLIYGFLPLLDELAPEDLTNPSEQEYDKLNQSIRFKVPLYATMIVDWYIFVQGIKILVGIELVLENAFNIAAMAYVIGTLSAISFTFSHQAFHKDSKLERIVGTVNMVKNLYIHFFTEHLYGHHRNVATPLDAASAPLGDNLYWFVPRSVIHSYKSSYLIQRDKFQKPFFLNMAVLSIALSISLPIAVCYYFGLKVAFFFVLNAAISIFILQTINFVEHYGLSRKQLPDGSYQPVNITHSWNTPARLTNYILFKLQRHSDHHENSFKEYQVLKSLPQSPHLPHGYSICILMAMIPPLWDHIIKPYAKEYQERKHEKDLKLATQELAYAQTQIVVYVTAACGMIMAYLGHQ